MFVLLYIILMFSILAKVLSDGGRESCPFCCHLRLSLWVVVPYPSWRVVGLRTVQWNVQNTKAFQNLLRHLNAIKKNIFFLQNNSKVKRTQKFSITARSVSFMLSPVNKNKLDFELYFYIPLNISQLCLVDIKVISFNIQHLFPSGFRDWLYLSLEACRKTRKLVKKRKRKESIIIFKKAGKSNSFKVRNKN